MANCNLCQKNTKLCESHIIPESVYKLLYDDKHRFKAIHSSTSKVSYHQKGFRERLLCNDCEQTLSKYENYVKGILTKEYPKISKMIPGQIHHFNIDYKKSRIFYLSVLWRMSITSHKYFQGISIPKHNEILRNLIQKENPGNPDEYGCIVSAPLIDGTFYTDWFLDPHLSKTQGDKVCWVVFGGLLYIFYLSFQHSDKRISQAFIQRNNKWLIPIDAA